MAGISPTDFSNLNSSFVASSGKLSDRTHRAIPYQPSNIRIPTEVIDVPKWQYGWQIMPSFSQRNRWARASVWGG
ncbi:hypothetical protein [Coleofasciculus sp. H7-2]|uniref:hypothetical protein n=1 Tax=Coleofasciculus sp. H7-2 TaxID=3351545 RepID=UPI0036718219